MLEQMRRGSKHPIVKGLFLLLALSFVVWGVGDVFRNNGGAGYVATVGKSGITAEELDNAVRGEVARYQQAIGKTLSEEEVEKFGIKRYVLGQLIRDKVTVARAHDLGLVAGKKVLAKHIYENDAFFDEKGKFSKERFKSVLSANGFNEEKYINAIQKDVAVTTLMEAVAASAIVPESIAKQVFSVRNESRVADLIILPANTSIEVAEPSETDLVQYYKDNQDNFAIPEQRALTYISFNLDKIKSTIKLSDDELKAEYQKSIQQYKTEESRMVQQYLFTKEDEANAAYEKISKGDAKAYAGSLIDLGSVTKTSAPAEVKDAIFALQKSEVSKPVKSSLGWHIFVVKSIEAEKTKNFESVKRDIEKDLLTAKASDEFSKFGNQVEDEFAAGQTMEEVAKKFDLVVHKVPSVDTNGNGANGSKVTDLPDAAVLLPVAFNLDTGAHSALTLLSDNASYAIVRVDTISPKRVKALDEAKGSAIKMWKDQQKVKLLQEQAVGISSKIRAGEDVKALSGKMKLKLVAAQNIKRPAADSVQEGKNGEPVILVRELFNLKKAGDVTSAYRNATGDFVIAQLKSVTKTAPDSDKNGYKNIQAELEDEMRDDILVQYINYLRSIYPVSVKEVASR